MTDTPPKPKRRRWRWLVVGLLLIAAIPAGWWYWIARPYVDVRLVGHWSRHDENTEGSMTVRFLADGTGQFYDDDGEPSFDPFTWRVQQGELMFYREKQPTLLEQFQHAVAVLSRMLSGQRAMAQQIQSISSDEVVVAVSVKGRVERQFYHRLPK